MSRRDQAPNCFSGMKQAHVLVSSERRERKKVGEGEKSREAGDGGGNHGYEDGAQTEEQEGNRDYLQSRAVV